VVGINRRPRPAPMMIARMNLGFRSGRAMNRARHAAPLEPPAPLPRLRVIFMTLGTATAIFSQSDWKINPPRRPRALFLTAVAHFGQHRPQP